MQLLGFVQVRLLHLHVLLRAHRYLVVATSGTLFLAFAASIRLPADGELGKVVLSGQDHHWLHSQAV